LAKIWLVEPGEPLREPVADKPLNFCFTVLGLRQRNFIGATNTDPLREGPYAVVEITEGDQDPSHPGWEIGFYRLNTDATEVRKLLEL